MDDNRIFHLKKINRRERIKIDVTEYDIVSYQPKYLSKATKVMKAPIVTKDMIIKFNEDHWKLNDYEERQCIELLKNVNFYTFKYYAKKEKCTNFKHTVNIYNFDRFLQNKIHRITLDIEMGIRTKIVDSLSLNYLEKPSYEYQPAQFFLDPNLYFSETGKHKKTPKREKEVSGILATFSDTIEQNKDKDIIKKELQNYESVSAWVLFDLLTLGDLSQFFGKLTTTNKKIVANNLNTSNILEGQIKEDLLSSWINAIRFIRNKSAHGSKIYGEVLNTLAKIHDHDKIYLEQVDFDNYLVSILLASRRIIACLSPDIQKSWDDALESIDNEIKNNKNLTAKKLGLTDNWLNYFKLIHPKVKLNSKKWKSRNF